MRELPEFQVLANHLQKSFIGKALVSVNVQNSKKLKLIQVEAEQSLKGNIIKSIYRFGKELHVQFFNNIILGIDLMLHGNVFSFDGVNKHKYTLAEFNFDNGRGLALTDWQANAIIKWNPDTTTDGVDALSTDLNSHLRKALQSKAKIKALITNQKVVRGIGNVYADEILWDARISPFSRSSAVPEFKIEALANSVKKVLSDAEKQITEKKIKVFSVEPYDFLNIYGKVGEKSPTGGIVKVDKKGGRSTYYTQEQVLYT